MTHSNPRFVEDISLTDPGDELITLSLEEPDRTYTVAIDEGEHGQVVIRSVALDDGQRARVVTIHHPDGRSEAVV